MPDERDTLLLPFEKGLLNPPSANARWLMFNAAPLPPSVISWKDHLECEQGFRPQFNILTAAGYRVRPDFNLGEAISDDLELAEGALVLAGRFRQVNQLNLQRAWNATRTGGAVLVAGVKTAGIQPLRKAVAACCGLEGSLSKHHAVAFWMRRAEGPWPQVQREELPVEFIDGYSLAPGMFSAAGPDTGSQLLAAHFDKRIRGRIADFGAGWGYLSAELLKRTDDVQSISLFEADFASLQAAKRNLGDKADFHWVDMVHEAPRGPFDWVIMNPPFHAGRAAEPKLGRAFIEAAARCLPAGGRLLMVANVGMPYEECLNTNFRRVALLERAQGFKVFEAVR